MYNEKNRTPSPFSRMQMQNGGQVPCPRAQMRDIPMGDRLDAMQPRRRCDGTLRDLGAEERPLGNMPRNSMDSPCPSDCAQGRCGGWGIENHPLAMVYSPCQAWRDAYSPDVALSRGTLFSELDLPLEAPKCKRGCL